MTTSRRGSSPVYSMSGGTRTPCSMTRVGVRIDRPYDRTGTSPDKAKPLEAATDGLAALSFAGLPG